MKTLLLAAVLAVACAEQLILSQNEPTFPVNREFQVRLNTSFYQANLKQLGFSLIQDLRSKLNMDITVTKTKEATETFEFYDTPERILSNASYVLQARRSDEDTVTMKYNDFDYERVATNRITAKKTAETKLEMDIYPCRFKYAKSVKIVVPKEFELKETKQLRELFSGTKSIAGLRGKQLGASRDFEKRESVSMAVLITVDKLKLGTKFVLTAAFSPEITTLEFSFRLPFEPARPSAERMRLIDAAWEIHSAMSSDKRVINC
jgi:hypothetical protein